jgi:hypothetical protein
MRYCFVRLCVIKCGKFSRTQHTDILWIRIRLREESIGSFFRKEYMLISMSEDTHLYTWGGKASGLYYEGAQFKSPIISPNSLVENFFVNFPLFFFFGLQMSGRVFASHYFCFLSTGSRLVAITQSFNGARSGFIHTAVTSAANPELLIR